MSRESRNSERLTSELRSLGRQGVLIDELGHINIDGGKHKKRTAKKRLAEGAGFQLRLADREHRGCGAGKSGRAGKKTVARQPGRTRSLGILGRRRHSTTNMRPPSRLYWNDC